MSDKSDKNSAPAHRARRRGQSADQTEPKLEILRKQEPVIRKILRKAAILSDRITGDDLEQNAQIIRDALNAEHYIFDRERRRLVAVPDHRTRLAAVALQLAYDEGLPVRREPGITTVFQGTDELLERLRQSPEAMRALRSCWPAPGGGTGYK